jgi:hypothetical protein
MAVHHIIVTTGYNCRQKADSVVVTHDIHTKGIREVRAAEREDDDDALRNK